MSTILTNKDVYFDFTNPEKHDFNIFEIAHALSNLCRFTGHVREFYSVAQHSVYVSALCPPELAMMGLLHDASEAYLGDVASPLKRLLPDYRAIEARVEQAIAKQHKLPYPLPAPIKAADLEMLAIEKLTFLPEGAGLNWPKPHARHEGFRIHPMQPTEARDFFIQRYAELLRKQWMH